MSEAREDLHFITAWVIEDERRGRLIVLRTASGEHSYSAAQANEIRIALDEALVRYDDPSDLPPAEPARAFEAPRLRGKSDFDLSILDDL